MKNITVAGLIAAPLLVFALAMPSVAADPAPTTCKDGTTTTSTGKGTCSGHGGVQKAAKTTTPAAAPATPATPAATGATTTCSDGTTTTSTGKGTCSGHGGIQKAAKAKSATAATAPAAAPAAAAPAAPAATAAKSSTATKSAPTATAGNTDPTGATAKCKDGTYSKSAHRSGTCSSHGGVAEWLTAAQ
jgi:Protein of unknown function (DUF3761)